MRYGYTLVLVRYGYTLVLVRYDTIAMVPLTIAIVTMANVAHYGSPWAGPNPAPTPNQVRCLLAHHLGHTARQGQLRTRPTPTPRP